MHSITLPKTSGIYYQSFIYSPTDALMSCLKKNNIKIYIKTALKYFGVTVTPKHVEAVLM